MVAGGGDAVKKKKPKKDDMNPLVWAFVCYALLPEEEREPFWERIWGRGECPLMGGDR